MHETDRDGLPHGRQVRRRAILLKDMFVQQVVHHRETVFDGARDFIKPERRRIDETHAPSIAVPEGPPVHAARTDRLLKVCGDCRGKLVRRHVGTGAATGDGDPGGSNNDAQREAFN